MIILKKIFDFIVFSSLFIALCAALMVYQTYFLFLQKTINFHLQAFVFFATICSYNFHWMLTPANKTASEINSGIDRHKKFHFLFYLVSLFPVGWLFFYFSSYWLWFCVAAVLTFLYSAPKIAFKPFQWLKKIAIGKTIFLSFVWTYVTAILPIIVEKSTFTTEILLYITGQFFFIFSLCILFDYRDKQDDINEGIRSLVIYFNERGINMLFFTAIILAAASFILLALSAQDSRNILVSLIPLGIVAFLYNPAKKDFSDYMYYFVLDGMLMVPGILIWIMNRF